MSGEQLAQINGFTSFMSDAAKKTITYIRDDGISFTTYSDNTGTFLYVHGLLVLQPAGRFSLEQRTFDIHLRQMEKAVHRLIVE